MTRAVKRWLLANSLLASLLLHGALFGGALGYLRWRESHAPRSIDIDLRGQSLLTRPANPQGGGAARRPPQPWYLSDGRRFAPPPKPEPLTRTAEAEEDNGPPCPPPCVENPGDWIPAAAASRRPVWTDGLITEDDYPRDLRRDGTEGKVVAEVLIDATGHVREVTLQQSSHPQFNELVLSRLRESRFQPAYDQNGDPAPCRLILPIVFQLN